MSGQPAGLVRRLCLPCPARQVLEAAFAVGVKGAFSALHALVIDPLTEPVAVVRAGPQRIITGQSAETARRPRSALAFHVQPGTASRRL